jgi:hypothetical protein
MVLSGRHDGGGAVLMQQSQHRFVRKAGAFREGDVKEQLHRDEVLDDQAGDTARCLSFVEDGLECLSGARRPGVGLGVLAPDEGPRQPW